MRDFKIIGTNLPRELMLKALERTTQLSPKPSSLEKAKDLVFLRTAQEIPASASAMAMFVNRGEIRHVNSH